MGEAKNVGESSTIVEGNNRRVRNTNSSHRCLSLLHQRNHLRWCSIQQKCLRNYCDCQYPVNCYADGKFGG